MRKTGILLTVFLILVLGPASAESGSLKNISYSVPPGTYSEDITLEVSYDGPERLFYSFLNYGNPSPVRYTGPVILSALTGEYRVYKMRFFVKDDAGNTLLTKNAEFTIDKTILRMPETSVSGGVYNRNVSISFEKTSGDVYYSASEEGLEDFSLWTGRPLVFTQSDYQKDITVTAFSKSPSGRKSPLLARHIIILPRDPVPEEIKVYSPAEGTFLNSQLLYLDTSGFKWLRYSIGRDDPAKFGTTYKAPVLFRAKGSYVLNIAGLPKNSTGILKKTVRFTISDTESEAADMKSGIYSDPVKITVKGKVSEYSLTSGGEDRFRPYDGKSIVLNPVEGIKTFYTLKLRPDSGQDGVYRYFYVFDKRVPGAPVISGTVNREKRAVDFEFFADPDADIFYTDNGSTPDKYAMKYKGPFSVKINAGIPAGSVMIKAVSIYKNGISGSVSSRLITYDLQPPEKPSVVLRRESNGRILVSVTNSDGNRIFYTVNYNGISPELPGKTSFMGSGEMILRFPRGMSGRMIMRMVLADSSGNLSDPVTVSMDYDTLPPPVPEVSFTGGSMRITGEGVLYYRFSDTDSHGEEGDFERYTEPVNEELFSVHKNVVVFAEDSSGNRSPLKTVDIPETDISQPVISFFGVTNNGIYNTGKRIRFFFSPDAEYYYSDSEKPDSGEASDTDKQEKLPGELSFDCSDGEEKDFHLYITAVNTSDRNIVSKYNLSFTIDKKKPSVPVTNSVIDGGVYRENRKLVFSGIEKDSEVWVVCSGSIEIPENLTKEFFLENGELVSDYYTVKTEDNTDSLFRLVVMAVDRAGNCAFSKDAVTFRIDRKPPGKVLFGGLPPRGRTNKPVTVTLQSEPGAEIFYRISRTDEKKMPGETEKYTKPVILDGISNRNISYMITAWAFDKAGNRTEKDSIGVVSIGQEKVSAIEPSFVNVNDYESVMSFEMLPDRTVYYKIGKNGYSRYDEPVTLNFRRSSSLIVFYYTTDSFRNTSPVRSRTLTMRNKKHGLVTGVADKGIYNTDVKISKKYSDSTVMYEAGITGTSIPPVSSLSPEISGPLEFEAADGQVLNIVLKVREYDKETLKPLSREEIYRFVLDREAPEAPRITGVSSSEFYQNGRHIEIKENGGTVLYELLKDGRSVTGGYRKYSGAINVDVDRGTFSEFTVRAYAVDSAGNKSRPVSVSFSIDKAIIYLSSKGKDSYDGTRTRPFRSFVKALKAAYRTGRKFIYITEGEFVLDSTVSITQDISVYGGFGTEGWTKSANRTFISAGRGYEKGTPLFDVASGSIAFKNITMTNLGINSPVITQRGGELTLEGCGLIYANAGSKSLLDISGGSFSLRDSGLVIGPLIDSVVIPARNSNVSILNVNIRGTHPVRKLRFFDFDNVKAEISDLYLDGMKSNVAEIFNLRNSRIKISGSSIMIPEGKISSSCFVLDNSSLFLTDSKIRGGGKTRIVSVFDSVKSDIRMKGLRISASAAGGISVFNSEDSRIEFMSGSIDIGDTGDFIYALRSDASDLNISGSAVTIGNSSDTVFIDAEDSLLVFKNNKVKVSSLENRHSLFELSRMKGVSLLNNRFILDSGSGSTAVSISGSNNIDVRDNLFLGWSSLLRFNDLILKTGEELNTFSGFNSSPSGNISR